MIDDDFLASVEKSAKRAEHEEVWTPVGCASPHTTLALIARLRAAEAALAAETDRCVRIADDLAEEYQRAGDPGMACGAGLVGNAIRAGGPKP